MFQIFADKVNVDATTGCWVWNKSTREGYGQLMVNGYPWTAHRYSYTLANGPIPDNLLVRHQCNNRLCCNPAHLTVGSHKDNWHDSPAAHYVRSQGNAKVWIINGIQYSNVRDASFCTGLSLGSLVKFTHDNTRVFDVLAYRIACARTRYPAKL